MTDKEKAQIIGEIVLDLNRVNQELTCCKAKAAKMGEILKGISDTLTLWSDPVRTQTRLPDSNLDLEGMNPQGLVERIHVLTNKRTELRDRLTELGVGA